MDNFLIAKQSIYIKNKQVKKMPTKLVMTISALFLAVIGISLSFLPNEIILYLGIVSTKPFQLILQILGALFFAFSMLNWMVRDGVIGGIYNRPTVVANFTHFVIGALALIKGVMANHDLPYTYWILAGVYTMFGLLFGLILFRNPASIKKVTN